VAAVKAAGDAVRSVLFRLEAPNQATEAFLTTHGVSDTTATALTRFPPDAFPATAAVRAALERLPGTTAVPDTIAVTARDATPPISDYEPGGNTLRVLWVPFPAFTESGARDYVGRSVAETLEAVRALTGLRLPLGEKGGVVLGREFWAAVLRGGYQGGVYFIDKLRWQNVDF
jgi:hypothetical protein